ncbi:chromatin remodelling complex Rsc7/Swp82 subunit-domain-containing protein [Choanephora cucurbitarum]|nr:chromatin remodelling complex Rsc7/Swp82 subunit-domain-containing protein [Choanephora cucurbitarum]
MVRRKRGRPPMAAASPPPPPLRKSRSSDRSVQLASPEETQNTRPSRKRGRPSSHLSTPDDSADSIKRRRDQSPSKSNDESDVDSAGEAKVDADGRLLGDREYKVPTFTLPDHGDQLLMLAMEPTKVLGFRDSYLLFHKHPQLKRVRISEEEKKMLVDMGLLVAWFKHRDVAVVTARSVFKCFGHKIVKRGKRIQDDYYEQDQPLRKNVEDEKDETELDAPSLLEDLQERDTTRKSLIGKTARSEGYISEAPMNQQTWMHHAALAARGFNAQLHERRIAKPVFYDIHSNVNQIPASLQSATCTFELISQEPTIEFKPHSNPHQLPLYRGIGGELLDYDVTKALDTLDQDKEVAQAVMKKPSAIKTLDNDEDSCFPLSLMEGQYQSNFPVHQARFNYTVPKIPDPCNLIDTAQSLAAQQYYLSLVYQSVNQFTPPQQPPQQLPTTSNNPTLPPVPENHQAKPVHLNRPPSQTFPIAPPPQQPMMRMPPTSTLPPPSNTLCGVPLGNNQLCQHPVSRMGERCSVHTAPKQMSEYTKGPPPSITYSDNKCADCHQLRAAETLFHSSEEHITDDFAVVKCAKCVRKYHPVCANLTTPRQVAAVESYPWSCPECKICCVCKSAGDESTLMICDGCDRGWHTGCCNPKVEKVPEGSWLCPLCANCHGCDEQGMAEESQYTHAIAPASDRYKYPIYLATYCNKCIQHFNQDRFCPVCLKTYAEEENDDEDNEMVACDTCDHWVHTRCDEILTPEKYQLLCDEEDAKYSCPMCEDRFKRLIDTSTADLALKGLSAPSGFCVGLLGGKVKTRGIVKYKDIKVGVPEINGTGIAEMPSN